MKECPTCGAPLSLKGSSVFCEYCSKTISGESQKLNKNEEEERREIIKRGFKFYCFIIMIFITLFFAYLMISLYSLKITPNYLLLLFILVAPLVLIGYHRFTQTRVGNSLSQFNDYDRALEINRFESWGLKFNIAMAIIVLLFLAGIVGDCHMKKKKANQIQNIKDEQRREINKENTKRF